jgi:hypothetical protein
MFRSGLGEEQFYEWFNRELLNKVHRSGPAPDIDSAGNRSVRANGWAAHNYCISPARTIRPNGEHPAKESHLIDLEVRADGGVRLFNGRATDAFQQMEVVLEAVVATSVLRTVQTAVAVAQTGRYLGSWHLGVAANNLHGKVSYAATRGVSRHSGGYSEDAYRSTATLTHEELVAVEPALTKLVGPLLHGLDSPYDLTSVR